MLLSVVVYNHKLTAGQWVGTGIVFAGISVEALVKRKGEHPPPAVRDPKAYYPLQRSTQNALRRRRKWQKSKNYNYTSTTCYWTILLSVLLSYTYRYPHRCHPFPSHRNTSSCWNLDVLAICHNSVDAPQQADGRNIRDPNSDRVPDSLF